MLEETIRGDFAFIRGWKADEKGNIIFRESARNFNPDMAIASNICVAEVEEIVPVGKLDPNYIHLPSLYVDRIVKCKFEKRVKTKMVYEYEHMKMKD